MISGQKQRVALARAAYRSDEAEVSPIVFAIIDFV